MVTGAIPQLPPQFAKLAALYRSTTFEDERATARRKAEAILPPEAGGFERALRIQHYNEVIANAGTTSLFAGFDEWQEIDDPGHMAKQAAQREEKRRKHESRRAELVAEFGSLKAVLEPCARERALQAAVKPWRKTQSGSRKRWTASLAGLGDYDEDKAPAALVAAIKGAIPWPSTYAEAIAEIAYWDRRNDDFELAARTDFVGDYMLDTPCLWRWRFVRDLAEHEMELRTIAEVAERMRAYRHNDTGVDEKIEDALIRDLDALAAQEVRA